MSILIKDMEMPTGCAKCPFEMYYINTGETRCRGTGKTLETSYCPTSYEKRDSDCPLVPVPKTIKDYPYKATTNGDRIRTMTDEKLAELFTNFDKWTEETDLPETKVYQCWLDWLKQEVDDGT